MVNIIGCLEEFQAPHFNNLLYESNREGGTLGTGVTGQAPGASGRRVQAAPGERQLEAGAQMQGRRTKRLLGSQGPVEEAALPLTLWEVGSCLSKEELSRASSVPILWEAQGFSKVLSACETEEAFYLPADYRAEGKQSGLPRRRKAAC